MRTALVTGGSRGIGRAVAEELLRAGHRVCITARSQSSIDDALAELSGLGPVAGLVIDASDSEATRRLLTPMLIDILVCNVGQGYSGTVLTTTVEDWQRVLATNVTSAFDAIAAVLPGMLERRWGRIVTVGSMGSHRPLKYGFAYTTSKHALWGLTRAVAEDFRGTGVTANMVAPAFVRTEMTSETAAIVAGSSGMSTVEAESRLAALSDWGRLIEPHEVATAIVALTHEDLEVTGTSATLGFDA